MERDIQITQTEQDPEGFGLPKDIVILKTNPNRGRDGIMYSGLLSLDLVSEEDLRMLIGQAENILPKRKNAPDIIYNYSLEIDGKGVGYTICFRGSSEYRKYQEFLKKQRSE